MARYKWRAGVMSELLLELFCEEIPALMQKNAESAYKTIFSNYFSKNEISFKDINVYIGPRRIAIHATGLPARMPAKTTEIKGPRLGAPDQAIEGFCRSNNIAKSNLTVQDINGQEFHVYIKQVDAKETKTILTQTLVEPVAEYVWPKSMYWGDYKIKWVRPLKNILCIFDEEILPFEYGHLVANNITYGHRFMAPDTIKVKNFTEYEKALENSYVMLCRHEREDYIKNELQKAAAGLDLTIQDDPYLVQEVAGLVEYPKILSGKIDPKFLSVPGEILVTSMRSNQKYFSLFDKNGNFAPYFLFVSNIESKEPELVIAGNEKVLSARLSDALFFYNQDLKITLSERAQGLNNVTFHKAIGSLGLKQQKVSDLCTYLAPGDKEAIAAAKIYKSDILSEVVGEFPTLQGIIGYYYAKAESLDDNIAVAIRDHYKPLGPSDNIPTDSAATLALADKLFDLISLTGAGERATGSKDPYALRRLALGIIRIIIHNKIHLNLFKVFEYFNDKIMMVSEEAQNYITAFIEERAKYYFKEDYEIPLINAVLDLKNEPDLYPVSLKLTALKAFLATGDGDNLLTAYKRTGNITGNKKISGQVDKAAFTTEHEQKLYSYVTDNSFKIQEFITRGDYTAALKLLAGMKTPVANFFDNVMVNDADLKVANNRLLLLEKTKQIFDSIAKFDLL
jgi:glycyl-tRNA synthetase beta chain